MLKSLFFVCLSCAFVVSAVLDTHAQAVTLTYQGSLRAGAVPANGSYDLKFDLYDDSTGTNLLGSNIINAVQVSGGVFTVQLTFPGAAFPDASSERYLEISVRPAGGPAYETLTPRQLFTSVPYSLRSETAVAASVATDAANLGGVAATEFVQTADERLSDARSPIAGSGNYIQNQNNGPQAASNFDISGTGNANAFNSRTQYDLFGQRVLGAVNTNTTIGFSAGAPNFGGSNTFAGFEAGSSANSNSSFNSFFGAQAGKANTTGLNNSFFGYQSGLANSGGGFNSFFGFASGSSNTTGNRNVFLGVTAGRDNTTASDNTFVGGSAGQRNITGELNTFSGSGAGAFNETGSMNAFYGASAGLANTTAGFNSFFGAFAGANNTTGMNNSFFGFQSGSVNSIGGFNSFFGYASGNVNTSGNRNAFFGVTAGRDNTDGSDNTFIGGGAGQQNQTGGDNTFVGSFAGVGNLTGTNNVFLGRGAGSSNTSGSYNTALGTGANVTTGALTNATAIGAGASVSTSNTLVLGRTQDTVRVPGMVDVDGELSADTVSATSMNVSGTVSSASLNVSGAGTIRSIAIGTGLASFNDVALSVTTGRTIVKFASGGFYDVCANVSSAVDDTYTFARCSSSIRYKTDINGLLSGLDLVRRLRPVTFRWKSNEMQDLGLIAEEVAAIEPLLATYNPDGEVEGVKYDRVGVVLVNAVNEQQAIIESQQKQMTEQERTIKRQQSEIDQLKAAVCSLAPAAAVCSPKKK